MTTETAQTTGSRTPRITDDSGRPDVTFDPCADIPYEIMIDAGYGVRNRKVADYPMGTYTFLGCRYTGTIRIPGVLARYGLSVLAGNVTLDEELAKNGDIAVPLPINGRPGLIELGPNGDDGCVIVLQTSFGITIFSRLYHKDHADPLPESEWCSGLEELVTAIEPYIHD